MSTAQDRKEEKKESKEEQKGVPQLKSQTYGLSESRVNSSLLNMGGVRTRHQGHIQRCTVLALGIKNDAQEMETLSIRQLMGGPLGSLTEALQNYRKNRENGITGVDDKSLGAFPNDGIYKFETPNESLSKIYYAEGKEDAKWMAEKDQNYLRRMGYHHVEEKIPEVVRPQVQSNSSACLASSSAAASVPAKSEEKKDEKKEEKKVIAVEQKEQKKNWTIVRVWLPRRANGKFCVAHSGLSVGHISLETNEIYASFWPKRNCIHGMKKKLGALLGTIEGVKVLNPQTDIEWEAIKEFGETERQPDVIVILHSLNTTKINQKFNEFQNSTVSDRWTVCGRNKFNVFNNGAGQNCSGLVYDLLNAGGMFDLDYTSDWTRMFVVAPDGVAKDAIRASEYEREGGLQEREPIQSQFGTIRSKIPNIELNFHGWSIGWWLSGESFKPKYPTYTPGEEAQESKATFQHT